MNCQSVTQDINSISITKLSLTTQAKVLPLMGDVKTSVHTGRVVQRYVAVDRTEMHSYQSTMTMLHLSNDWI